MTSTKIIFTSCMDAMRVWEQPIWKEIAARDPNYLLLLGDQIYMDWGLSVSKTPRWKRIIDKNKQDGLEAFAEEMYARYKRQWEVPSFQALIRQMQGRVRVVWDDHDFAWNNSVGEGDSTYTVSKDVRAVSRRLFAQFAEVLRAPPSSYPARAEAPSYFDGTVGVEGQLERVGDVDLLMLDTRLYRTHRDQDDRHLLAGAPGTGQRKALLDAVATPDGLLIVAGGSPMRHHYRFSEQGWYADEGADEHAYPEYDELIQKSHRPVLYLGGDIHRNAWGGRLATKNVPMGSSRVVQAVSSGAAIGRVLIKRFTPSFGEVDVAAANRQVTVRLCTLEDATPQQTTLRETRYGSFNYTADNWGQGVPESEEFEKEFGEAGLPVNDPELSVLVCRERRSKAFPGTQCTCLAEQLDGLYDETRLLADAFGYAEPLRITLGSVEHSLSVERLDPASEANLVVMREAFERALQRGKQSVAFFVHGFNKSFGESIDQAYAFKERYPASEPILLSWPSGEDGGLISAGGKFDIARKAAKDIYVLLGKAFAQFAQLAGEPRYQGLAKVIVARSLGAQAVADALEGMRSVAGNLESLSHVQRIVLSAPALPAKKHRQWADALPCPLVVLFNRSDRKLKYADWMTWGALLGNQLPDEMSAQGVYVDLTGSTAVGTTHDHFLLRLNTSLNAFNEHLVCDRHPIAWPQAGFVRDPSTRGIVLRAVET